MKAQIFHGTRETEVCCQAAAVELHLVEVSDDTGHLWQFEISPRVNTPMRERVVMASAIKFVGSKLESIQ